MRKKGKKRMKALTKRKYIKKRKREMKEGK
jgi:hypothetical protein